MNFILKNPPPPFTDFLGLSTQEIRILISLKIVYNLAVYYQNVNSEYFLTVEKSYADRLETVKNAYNRHLELKCMLLFFNNNPKLLEVFKQVKTDYDLMIVKSNAFEYGYLDDVLIFNRIRIYAGYYSISNIDIDKEIEEYLRTPSKEKREQILDIFDFFNVLENTENIIPTIERIRHVLEIRKKVYQ